jgi:anti-anti-sigma factor
MSLLARVREEGDADLPIAVVEGELDASNVAEIGERLRAPLSNRSAALVVDLGEMTYIDSAGLNLLFELASELGHRQQRLHLVVPPDSNIARMLAIAGLPSVVPVHATREVAISSFSAR